MTTKAETEANRVKRFNQRQVAEAARRVHDLQKAALGTKGAHRISQIEEGIRTVLESEKEYLDQDCFIGPGFLMRIDRLGSPWPTMEFFVPATNNMYFHPEKPE